MNEDLISGFSELSDEQKSLVVAYVTDKNNWAKLVNRKPKEIYEASDSNFHSSTHTKKESSTTTSSSNVFSEQLSAVTIDTSKTSLVMKSRQSFELM
jgi:deoxyxylulose-5-phosphate synthase